MQATVYSITPNLSRFGGAQKVMVDIHNGIKHNYNAKILCFQSLKSIHPKYDIEEPDALHFTWIQIYKLKNKIVIVHGRNLATLFTILNFVLFLNIKLVYVAHNVYNNYKFFTFLPKNIVSISESVTNNLTNFFNIDPTHITLIRNGIQDRLGGGEISVNTDSYPSKINILYSARINKVKRQIEMFQNLEGKLNDGIKIYFAGTGPDYNLLKDLCHNSNNFEVLGFVDNLTPIISFANYLMLYSRQEGLPLSLIEGTMFGKPLLINDVGGNLEIGLPNTNAILLRGNWDALAKTLNGLFTISLNDYSNMCHNSRAIYLSRFTYEGMTKKYVDYIDNLNS